MHVYYRIEYYLNALLKKKKKIKRKFLLYLGKVKSKFS